MNPNELIAAVDAITRPAPPPEYIDEEDSTVRTGWMIQTRNTANWAMQRDAQERKAIANLESEREDVIRRVNARYDSLIDKCKRAIAFFESHLGMWATDNRAELLKGSNLKSIDLGSGRIGWRKQSPRLVVVDDQALGAWLREQDDVNLFRIKIEPAMKELQDNFKAKGVIPPGMELVTAQEKIYFDPIDLTTTLARGNK